MMVTKLALFIREISFRYWNEAVAMILGVILTQVLFYLVSLSHQNTIRLSIEAILKKEDVISNPYKVSQQIESIEALGMISCTKLFLGEENVKYLDSSYKGGCGLNLFYLNGTNFVFNVNSSTGQMWRIESEAIFSREVQGILWLLRILALLFAFYAVRFHNLRLESLSREKDLNYARQEGAIQSAKQVAHDIRSPLSALNMIASTLTEISEEKRVIIRQVSQRINDIANNLLKQSKVILKGESSEDRKSALSTYSLPTIKITENTMLVALIDSIISEKRIQSRDKMNIQIEGNLIEGYGLFADVCASELSRVFSNLIDNSIEAIDSNQGRIAISLECESRQNGRELGEVKIRIKDNGKGIPPSILGKLGKTGVSYGKHSSFNGFGLGIIHAAQTVESYGGSIKFESEDGTGTLVTLSLPQSKSPKWLAEKLDLVPNQTIISVDDDRTIHQIWQQRISSAMSSGNQIAHLAFSSPQIFEKWWRENAADIGSNVLFLLDYEFIGSDTNGLELINTLAIESKSVLVTSKFEESDVLNKAQKMGIRLIPKGLSPIVPIFIAKDC